MTFSASDIWFVLVLLLFIAAFLVMVTFYANEGKDERGRHIVSTAAGWTYPVLLIGWGLLEIGYRLFHFELETYHSLVFVLVAVCYIVQALVLYVLKKRV